MNLQFPIYHVLVVGFHHKRGCQVEFAYPKLEEELENTAWKHLPTLAMPDGAHNFERDTVYFHLPSLNNPKETVFGVACYQQINASQLKNKTDDVTRSTVQKSVCILSRYPLYGHIQVKMKLITDAYFREGDFSQISLLEEAFHNLNACLTPESLDTPELFVGLSPRELVFTFNNQVLILLKLLLLERKILFRGPSVGPLCSALLTLVSLLPESVGYGLSESACVKTSKSMSIVPNFEDGKEKIGDRDENSRQMKKSGSVLSTKSLEGADAQLEKCEEVPDFITAVNIQPSEAGLPLEIFANGYLCHPYLSLNYLDLLSDTRVRGFLVGATNVLFKQKKDLVEVVVEVKDGTVDILCPNLKRLVTLTTRDLRFTDNIVKTVNAEGARKYDGDSFMDGVGWEGGDEWIRAQFKYYLMCLMRTSLTDEGHRSRDCFYGPFVKAWERTHNWQTWHKYVTAEDRDTPGVYALCPGHPNDGNISMSDVKIKLAHVIQNTESGRRVNHALGSTSRAVANTGKAVGDALSQAKETLSSWWGNVTTSNGSENTFSSPIIPDTESENKSSHSNIDTNETADATREIK